MLVLCTLLFVVSAYAQIIVPFNCPKVSVKPDFDVQKYVGRWFEQRQYCDANFECRLQCVTTTYTDNHNGSISVQNQGIFRFNAIENSSSGRRSSITGLAYAERNEKAKFRVKFPPRLVKGPNSYWILDTDYTSYAIVWSCYNRGVLLNYRYAWILTRERQASDDILEKAYKVLDKYNIDTSLLLKTNQTNCPEN